MIKYVRRANQWCVTKITETKGKILQEQTWHSSKSEAYHKDKEADNESTV